MGFNLSFLGGASSIGASCALLEVDNTTLVIDCGIRLKGERLPNLEALSGKNIDAVLVTHAHTDHTGALPLIAQSFPTTPIYGTAATLALVDVLQKDALNIMQNSVETEGDIPIYAKEDVERMQMLCRPINFNTQFSIGCCTVSFFAAGHILGAAMLHIATPYGAILFTGDYSLSSQHTLPKVSLPKVPVDVLVTESTYGGRLHQDRKFAERKLISQVQDVLNQNGKVLIPCFAIGRAQEVLAILHGALQSKQLPAVPCFVDGMVRSVLKTYKDFTFLLSKKGKHIFEEGICKHGIQLIHSMVDRQAAIQQPGPAIFVASSGMLTGGPSAFFASHLVSNPNDAILITGYQDEESPGRALLALAKGESKELDIFGKKAEVKCQVSAYSLSAHADEGEVLSLIRATRPKKVVLVHGDEIAQKSIAKKLQVGSVLLAKEGDLYTFQYSAPKSRKEDEQPKTSGDEASLTVNEMKELRAQNPFAALEMTCQFLGLLKPIETKTVHGSGYSCTLSIHFMDQELLSQKFVHERFDIARLQCALDLLEKITKKLRMDEDVQAGEIADDNYKSKLCEACIKEGNPKYLVLALPGPRFRCVAELNGLSSKVFEAKSRKDVEQAAAKDLFIKYQAHRESSEILPVSQESRLPKENPLLAMVRAADARGKLNELCQHKVIAGLQYEDLREYGEAHKKMFELRIKATLPNGVVLLSDAVSASSKREGQKKAAELLFAQLVREYANLGLEISRR